MSIHRRDLIVQGEGCLVISSGGNHIEALFKNVAWDAVEARHDRAMKASAALG